MYKSLERSTQVTRDGFDLYSARSSFAWPHVDLTRLLRRGVSQPFWIIPFEFVKVSGIRFSIRKSLIGFYIWCYPISTILAFLVAVGVRISYLFLPYTNTVILLEPYRGTITEPWLPVFMSAIVCRYLDALI